MTTADLVHLRRARDLIDRDYALPLDVPAMARAAHASPSHFARCYREAFGETPYQHLLTRRIERAMALLRDGDTPVRDVCEAVGFHSLGSFSARFHEIVGMSPTAYRAAASRARGRRTRVPGCMARALARPSRNRETAAARPG